jgi:hypothetical protein
MAFALLRRSKDLIDFNSPKADTPAVRARPHKAP